MSHKTVTTTIAICFDTEKVLEYCLQEEHLTAKDLLAFDKEDWEDEFLSSEAFEKAWHDCVQETSHGMDVYEPFAAEVVLDIDNMDWSNE